MLVLLNDIQVAGNCTISFETTCTYYVHRAVILKICGLKKELERGRGRKQSENNHVTCNIKCSPTCETRSNIAILLYNNTIVYCRDSPTIFLGALCFNLLLLKYIRCKKKYEQVVWRWNRL